MWRVRYYLSGGTLTSRDFPSMEDAVRFMVYSICSWNVYDSYLIN